MLTVPQNCTKEYHPWKEPTRWMVEWLLGNRCQGRKRSPYGGEDQGTSLDWPKRGTLSLRDTSSWSHFGLVPSASTFRGQASQPEPPLCFPADVHWKLCNEERRVPLCHYLLMMRWTHRPFHFHTEHQVHICMVEAAGVLPGLSINSSHTIPGDVNLC